MKPRYHVYLGDRRTSVTLDPTLEALLALRLGQLPDSRLARKAVRLWLQARLDEHNDPARSRVSQWLQTEVIFEIADKRLSGPYSDWILNSD